MNRRDIELFFKKHSSDLEDIPDVGVDEIMTFDDFIEAVEELEEIIKKEIEKK